MKTPHKHAEIIKAWADGEKIEIFDDVNECWESCANPRWTEHHKYRVALNEFKIGEWTAPKPYTEKLEDGQEYYTPSVEDTRYFSKWVWRNDTVDNLMLGRGLVHLTSEAAFKHGRALAAFSENIENA